MNNLATVTITSTYPGYDILDPGPPTRPVPISDSLRRIITRWRMEDIATTKREHEPAETQQGYPTGDRGSIVPSSEAITTSNK